MTAVLIYWGQDDAHHLQVRRTKSRIGSNLHTVAAIVGGWDVVYCQRRGAVFWEVRARVDQDAGSSQ
jgi:hypothetical protein